MGCTGWAVLPRRNTCSGGKKSHRRAGRLNVASALRPGAPQAQQLVLNWRRKARSQAAFSGPTGFSAAARGGWRAPKGEQVGSRHRRHNPVWAKRMPAASVASSRCQWRSEHDRIKAQGLKTLSVHPVGACLFNAPTPILPKSILTIKTVK